MPRIQALGMHRQGLQVQSNMVAVVSPRLGRKERKEGKKEKKEGRRGEEWETHRDRASEKLHLNINLKEVEKQMPRRKTD